ncbi:hypothetical protein [Actinophytocola sp.]|uniref:hypothetical protein n=1 Tax=Actinophytocola sp. TaxID=1872138 RepID=UPI002D80EEC8|nr:hypothetical protein [Actinophytocola sp.]
MTDTLQKGHDPMAAQIPSDVTAFQRNWRFCVHCFGLWWNGNPTNGHCPSPNAPVVGGRRTHTGPSWDFYLPADPDNGLDANPH